MGTYRKYPFQALVQPLRIYPNLADHTLRSASDHPNISFLLQANINSRKPLSCHLPKGNIGAYCVGEIIRRRCRCRGSRYTTYLETETDTRWTSSCTTDYNRSTSVAPRPPMLALSTAVGGVFQNCDTENMHVSICISRGNV